MKKLMIAALVAAAGSAFAACVDPSEPAPADCTAAVYQWQFKGKTAVGALIKGSTTSTKGTTCADGTTTSSCAEVIRVPGNLAIAAYTYICCDECQTLENNLLNPTYFQYRLTKPSKTKIYRDSAAQSLYGVVGANFVTGIDAMHVIGKSATQCEFAGNFKFAVTDADDLQQVYQLYAAGFGSWNKSKGVVSSVSGNFAGRVNPARYIGKASIDNGLICIPTWCPIATYWNCVTLDYIAVPEYVAPAYGTWSAKYNASASKKLANNSKYRVLTK